MNTSDHRRNGALAATLLLASEAALQPRVVRQWLAGFTSVTLHGGLVAALLWHASGPPALKAAPQARDLAVTSVSLVPAVNPAPSTPAEAAPPAHGAARRDKAARLDDSARTNPASTPTEATVRPASNDASSAGQANAASAADQDQRVGAAAAETPSGRAGAAVATDYGERILAYIEKYRRPNASGVAGAVELTVNIDRRGAVLAVVVDRSSGSKALDQEAQAMIWRAQPLPPIPMELPDDITLHLPVMFAAYGAPGR